MGQDAGIGKKVQALDDASAVAVSIILAHDHSARAAASDDRARLVSSEHGVVTGAAGECLTQVTREAAEHVNQARLTDASSYSRVVSRGFVDEGEELNLRGTEALEPAYTIAARTLVIVVGRGCRRDNADERAGSACKLDGTAVGEGHLPAKFGAAFGGSSGYGA